MRSAVLLSLAVLAAAAAVASSAPATKWAASSSSSSSELDPSPRRWRRGLLGPCKCNLRCRSRLLDHYAEDVWPDTPYHNNKRRRNTRKRACVADARNPGKKAEIEA